MGMGRRPISIRIKSRDLASIEEILRSGVAQVRVVIRALALRQLGHGTGAPQVSQALPLTAKAVRQIAHRYDSGGLDRALYDSQRSGARPLLNDSQRQSIIAMVRGDPPAGRARWTVRLVAEEAVRRKLVPRAGRETIRMLLQENGLKPWREKNVVRGGYQPANPS